MASSPRVARRGRGRPRRSRPTIVVGNTCWEAPRLPEMSNRARAGSSRFKPRHVWQRKMFLLLVTPSQPMGASRAVRGGKGGAYVEGKGVLAERAKNVKLQRKVPCQSLGCCSFENSLTSLATRSRPIVFFISPSFPPGPLLPRLYLVFSPTPIASSFYSESPIGALYLPFHETVLAPSPAEVTSQFCVLSLTVSAADSNGPDVKNDRIPKKTSI